MDINKIINIIREQRILKEFGVPPGAPGLSGGGGGTIPLTSQAKVRSIRQMITDPNGSSEDNNIMIHKIISLIKNIRIEENFLVKRRENLIRKR